MAQQKVVMKLSMQDVKKRAKAMHCAVGMSGVLSVSHEGDKITMLGEGIDSVELTRMRQKKLGHVELEVVMPVEEKKKEVTKVEEKKKGEVTKVEEKKKVEAPVICPYCYGLFVGPIIQPHYCFAVAREPTYDHNKCFIL